MQHKNIFCVQDANLFSNDILVRRVSHAKQPVFWWMSHNTSSYTHSALARTRNEALLEDVLYICCSRTSLDGRSLFHSTWRPKAAWFYRVTDCQFGHVVILLLYQQAPCSRCTRDTQSPGGLHLSLPYCIDFIVCSSYHVVKTHTLTRVGRGLLTFLDIRQGIRRSYSSLFF